MMLALTLVATINPKDIVKYEMDRLNTDYQKALKLKKPVVIWVNMGDPFDEYCKINKDVTHVFVNSFPGMEKGVVLGIPSRLSMYRYDIRRDYARTVNDILNRQLMLENCPPGAST